MRKFYFIVAILFSSFLTSCYVGEVVVNPERFISVQDSNGNKLTDYDLYIYRCTHPGSQFDDVFLFENQASNPFHLENKTKLKSKRIGGVWLAPDYYASYEPQPYWVACVSKKGFADKRWGLGNFQGKNVTIKLEKSDLRGSDICHTQKQECSACKAYDYFMYEPMRYQGCSQESLSK